MPPAGVNGDGTVFELAGTGCVVVSEPAGLSLLALGSLPLLRRRRMR